MKKITLALSGLLFIQLANAQVSKGSFFTGGSATVSSSSGDNNSGSTSKNTSWSVSPQLGTAISENKIIGIQLLAGGNITETNNGTSSKNTGNAYGLGIFYRQYYPVASKWMLFGQATLSGSFGNGKNTSLNIQTDKNTNWTTGLGITPGITYQVSKKIWLEAALSNLFAINYSSQKTEGFDQAGSVISTLKRNDFSAAANVNGFNSISVGIRWIIPKS